MSARIIPFPDATTLPYGEWIARIDLTVEGWWKLTILHAGEPTFDYDFGRYGDAKSAADFIAEFHGMEIEIGPEAHDAWIGHASDGEVAF